MGSNHWKAKLNEGDVKRIKKDMNKGMKNNEIAEKYGVSSDSISKIRTNKTWIHVCV